MKNVEENLNKKSEENLQKKEHEISSEEIFSFNIWLLINFGFCKN